MQISFYFSTRFEKSSQTQPTLFLVLYIWIQVPFFKVVGNFFVLLFQNFKEDICRSGDLFFPLFQVIHLDNPSLKNNERIKTEETMLRLGLGHKICQKKLRQRQRPNTNHIPPGYCFFHSPRPSKKTWQRIFYFDFVENFKFFQIFVLLI